MYTGGIVVTRAIPIGLISFLAACAGAQTPSEDAREALVEAEDEDAVRPLDQAMVVQSLRNMGCERVQILESATLEDPEGLVVVMTAEICEGFEELGVSAMIVTAVGNEYLQSNTLLPLPGLGGEHAEAVEVLELRAPRVSSGGETVVRLVYRVPPTGEEGGDFVERVAIGTFSADALELSVVQPVRYELGLGRSRLQGEGTVVLEDVDDDGDLDLRFDLRATGERCGRGSVCRNGEHTCQMTSAWTGRRFNDSLSGDGCLYLGQLEL